MPIVSKSMVDQNTTMINTLFIFNEKEKKKCIKGRHGNNLCPKAPQTIMPLCKSK